MKFNVCLLRLHLVFFFFSFMVKLVHISSLSCIYVLCVVGNAGDLVDWTGLDGRPLGSQESIINSYIITYWRKSICVTAKAIDQLAIKLNV